MSHGNQDKFRSSGMMILPRRSWMRPSRRRALSTRETSRRLALTSEARRVMRMLNSLGPVGTEQWETRKWMMRARRSAWAGCHRWVCVFWVVDAEDIKLLEEKHHLRLGYRHEIAGGEGGEGGGVALGETEESLNLNDVGGLDGLAYCISVVGGVIFETETAVGEDDDRLAAVALADDATAGRMLEEVELGVGDNLLEVVACHTHEERQLEQGGKSYHRAILSFMLGENHTSLAPSAPARMK